LPAVAAWASPAAQLTTLGAIHRLSNEQASKAVPVAFEATVTYFRSYEKTLFVQDDNLAIYVQATTRLELLPGDRILVRGVTKESFRPIIVSSDLLLLHHGPPPRPVPADFGSLIQAKLDCRYVTLRGIVRSATLALATGHQVTQMELEMRGGYAGITVDEGALAQLSDLVDAEVEVTGAEAGRFDGKMQQTGVLLHTTSFDSLHLLHKASVDPWSLPLTPMDQVLNAYDVDEHTRRVRIEGNITYFEAGRMAVLQDGNRSMRLLTPTIDTLHVGDRAEAIGMPFVDNGFLTLKLADLRTTGEVAPVTPRAVTWDELATGKHAFDLVTIDGVVITQVREHAQDVYIIAVDGHLFSATVRHPSRVGWGIVSPPPPMPLIPSGSEVKVTGVAIHDDANPFNGPMAFGILLRSSSDVVVIASPSWLNVRNLILIVSLLLILVALVGMWVWMLRRKVHRQTAQLAAQKEAEANLERQRSRILEDINGTRPLGEILQQIVDLVSFRLNAAPCGCEVGDALKIGSIPREPGSLEPDGLEIVRQEILSRSGPLHGVLFAAVDRDSPSSTRAAEVLSMGTWLATLAIETRGLYSDLVHRSEFDLLTDIYNRFSLERRLCTLIEESRQKSASFGMIYIDLDDFKQVNDRFGHRVGDLYLQEAAKRMKQQLRPTDMLARIGGDEFAVLLPNVRSHSDVGDVAFRLEHCFLGEFELGGHALQGSASVGTALYPDDGATKDSLFSAADAAMYVNKKIKKEVSQSSYRR
jgi:diguanylate cyclase (GGDEF)-like protein